MASSSLPPACCFIALDTIFSQGTLGSESPSPTLTRAAHLAAARAMPTPSARQLAVKEPQDWLPAMTCWPALDPFTLDLGLMGTLHAKLPPFHPKVGSKLDTCGFLFVDCLQFRKVVFLGLSYTCTAFLPAQCPALKMPENRTSRSSLELLAPIPNFKPARTKEPVPGLVSNKDPSPIELSRIRPQDIKQRPSQKHSQFTIVT